MNLKAADLERMKHIETEIAKTVAAYRENTEAALVIFALLRVARTLLSLYSKKSQDWLIEDVGIPFLRGAPQMGRVVDIGTLTTNGRVN